MIRRYRDDDFESVLAIWFSAMQVSIPALLVRMGHTLENSREFFRTNLTKDCDVWVYEHDDHPAAFISLKGEFIDRLYVSPHHQRQGIGLALLDHARNLSPLHLWLYTDQANKLSRSFYEKNGFTAIRFGVTPPPASEPDVEYHWYPK